jgi:hypothetical protein
VSSHLVWRKLSVIEFIVWQIWVVLGTVHLLLLSISHLAALFIS